MRTNSRTTCGSTSSKEGERLSCFMSAAPSSPPLPSCLPHLHTKASLCYPHSLNAGRGVLGVRRAGAAEPTEGEAHDSSLLHPSSPTGRLAGDMLQSFLRSPTSTTRPPLARTGTGSTKAMGSPSRLRLRLPPPPLRPFMCLVRLRLRLADMGNCRSSTWRRKIPRFVHATFRVRNSAHP